MIDIKKLLITPLLSYSIFAGLPEDNRKHLNELADYMNSYNKKTKSFMIDSLMDRDQNILKNEYNLKELERKIKSLEKQVEENKNGNNFDLNFINIWLEKRYKNYTKNSSDLTFQQFRNKAQLSTNNLYGFSLKVMEDFVQEKLLEERDSRNKFVTHNHYTCLKELQTKQFADSDGIIYFAASKNAAKLFAKPIADCDDLAGEVDFYKEPKEASIGLGSNIVYGVDIHLNKIVEQCSYEFDGMKCQKFKINY